MTTFKRKRGAYSTKVPKSAFARKVARARAATSSQMVIAGSTRSVGYYGRMSSTGTEQKFLDVQIADASISATGDIQNSGTLLVIASGAGESQRVGRKVTIRKMMCRGEATLNEYDGATAADASAANRVRIIFYLDKQCNGAAATAGDILGPGTVNTNSFNELVNKGRFTILKDKIITLNPMALAKDGTNYVRPRVNKSFFFAKKCNIPIEYDTGGTGAITEIRSNNIGCLLVADSAVAGFPCTVTALVRFRYTDI